MQKTPNDWQPKQSPPSWYETSPKRMASGGALHAPAGKAATQCRTAPRYKSAAVPGNQTAAPEKQTKYQTDESRTHLLKPSSTETGGSHPSKLRALLISTCNEPNKR